MTSNPSPAPGWYRDPAGSGERWWNGIAWSDAVRAPGAPHVLAPPAPGGAGVPPVAVTQPYPGARPVVAPTAWGPQGAVARRPVRGMGDAIRAVFAGYADFTGRASRAEYWYWYLFLVLVSVGALLLVLVPIVGFLVVLALIAWSLGTLVPQLAVTVRRLRDAGYHWALLFLGLIPVGGIVLLVLLCQPSAPARATGAGR